MSGDTLHVRSESGTCLCGEEWFEDQCTARDTFAGAAWELTARLRMLGEAIRPQWFYRLAEWLARWGRGG